MRRGELRIVQKLERDPARGELALDLVDFLGRRGGVTRNLIGGLCVADVEQFAREEPSLDPPFVGVVQVAHVTRHREHQAPGFGDLVLTAQQLQLREQVSDVVTRFMRHCFCKRFRLARLVRDCNAQPRDCELYAAEALRRAQAGVGIIRIEPALHARLVVAGMQERSELFANLHSASAEKLSSRHAWRTSACARSRSPCASTTRASATRPLPVSGGSAAKYVRTEASSGRSMNAMASARLRNMLMLGQVGLAETNAA